MGGGHEGIHLRRDKETRIGDPVLPGWVHSCPCQPFGLKTLKQGNGSGGAGPLPTVQRRKGVCGLVGTRKTNRGGWLSSTCWGGGVNPPLCQAVPVLGAMWTPTSWAGPHAGRWRMPGNGDENERRAPALSQLFVHLGGSGPMFDPREALGGGDGVAAAGLAASPTLLARPAGRPSHVGAPGQSWGPGSSRGLIQPALAGSCPAAAPRILRHRPHVLAAQTSCSP